MIPLAPVASPVRPGTFSAVRRRSAPGLPGLACLAGVLFGLAIGVTVWAEEPAPAAGSTPPSPVALGPGPAVPSAGRASRAVTVEPGEVLVKLREGSATAGTLRQEAAGRAVALQSIPAGPLREQLRLAGVERLEPVFRVAGVPSGPRVRLKGPGGRPAIDPVQREGLFRWYRLRLAEGIEPREAAAALQTAPDVECAEPNIHYRLAGDIPTPITGLPDGTTDPGITNQWHLTFCKVQRAWNHLKEQGLHPGGSRDVVVAVIDSGVDATHPDLVANLWTNGGEIPGNGLDDDANGFVDDLHGCSVVSAIESHSGDSSDYHGHGTHVAGILAGTAFNHTGGVGVAFNVEIMAIRAAQYSGTLTTTDIAEGVLYAIDHGAEVISMSFGGYLRSQVMEDTLEVALSQAMLVAAAGNDSLKKSEAPLYPAALHYVMGVMACQPDGGLAWFSNSGYDISAPGESIWSTLPGNNYAAWSGTSMATPVISGIAALMRSYYWQRDVWSVRFLMGGLWASGGDAYRALTELPAPGVDLKENWLFDDTGIDPDNDPDGRADSGETLHLGIELINRSGYASQVIARLEAIKDGAILPDPYVSIDVPLVDWGPMGPFITKDNGFLYNPEGVITGVARPFVFSISPDCPNDHVIPFRLTVDFEDGWDTNHKWYTRILRFNYLVQRGKNVPTVIRAGSTVTLDPAQYWIVGGPVMVEAGATLNIGAGTQVQWGAVSDDPYNPGPQPGHLIVEGRLNVTGTAPQPASLFPSYLVAGQQVRITVRGNGRAELSYLKVRNPDLTGIHSIAHGYFEWDAFASRVEAVRATDSIFHKFRGGGSITAADGFERCLFDAGWVNPGPEGTRFVDCVFLQDNENLRPLQLNVPWSFSARLTREFPTPNLFYHPLSTNGSTYVVMPLERGGLRLAETMARYYGGHVTSIRNQAEYDLIQAWIEPLPKIAYMDWFAVGLSDLDHPGQFEWTDGSPLTFTRWKAGEPSVPSWTGDRLVVAGQEYAGTGKFWGDWYSQTEWYRRDGANVPEWWKQFLLRLPGTWTIPDLEAPIRDGRMLDHVLEQFPGVWRRNAFLNRYWDPAVSTWMRFRAPADPTAYSLLRDNYLGTDSTNLINHAIIDYYDGFSQARIAYGTPPAVGYVTTYPFVEKVEINGLNAVAIPELGGGLATFRVTFNRDMDQAVEPFVTFGPSPPHTDFQIKARGEDFLEIPSGWLDARTWQGRAWITPVTGDGYHLMRLSGAVCADDPWLVSGYDVGRFRFKVATSTIESMTLQATGREGRIDLSWMQDDYDLLAGYNLYRSDGPEGPWTRLNPTIIPKGRESFVDTGVQPAIRMYYRFSVMTTDLQESAPSEVVSAAATDTVPPSLTHTPVVAAVAGRGLRLTAGAADNVGVSAVVLHHRPRGSTNDYSAVPMLNSGGDGWSATIPASSVQPPGVDYYLLASDGLNEVLSGTAATPHVVIVENQPSLTSVTPGRGPAAGGTVVTLAGAQFQAGATVTFGGEPATAVGVVSANQITCSTPPHFPAQVDVAVLNPDGSRATLLNGFRFEASGVALSLPEASGDQGSTVELALAVDQPAGLRAVELVVAFDPAVLTPVDARVGTPVADWGLASNLATPGRLRLTMAGSTGATGAGVLAFLRFQVVGTSPASTDLTLESVRLNDGALTPQLRHGRFAVNGDWSLGGTVRYFQEARPVPGVDLSLVGAGVFETTTTAAGTFALDGLPTGSYSLLPEKSGDAAGITAYDASLVLQAAAGLLTLGPAQVQAADVNRNGLVSAMDASYILQRSVGLIGLPFPGAGRVWDFEPAQRNYALLSADQSGQDFTAVLIGDVSGNWPASGLLGGGDGESPRAVLAVRPGGVTGSPPTRWWVLVRTVDSGLHSLDLNLSFSGSPAPVLTVQPDGLAAEAVTAVNNQEPGRLRVALARARPVSGVGALLLISASRPVDGRLEIASASADEGRVRLQVDASGADFDADTDGDRQTDWQEVLCGTDPADRASVLAIQSATREAGNAVRVEWSSVAGRRYQLQSTSAIPPASWEPAGDVVTATGPRSGQTHPAPGHPHARLYRVLLVE